jgi:hypothetical protein
MDSNIRSGAIPVRPPRISAGPGRRHVPGRRDRRPLQLSDPITRIRSTTGTVRPGASPRKSGCRAAHALETGTARHLTRCAVGRWQRKTHRVARLGRQGHRQSRRTARRRLRRQCPRQIRRRPRQVDAQEQVASKSKPQEASWIDSPARKQAHTLPAKPLPSAVPAAPVSCNGGR